MRLAPLNEALRATSGMPRRSPTTARTGSWYAGRVKIAETPPLPAQGSAPAYRATTALRLSFQAESGVIRPPPAVSRRVVPSDGGDQGVGGRPVHDPLRAERAARTSWGR